MLFPTGYRGEPSTKGFNADLLVTPIVGEIIGKRKKEAKGFTFANAGFAQLITGDIKYNFFPEEMKTPAFSTGFIYSLALSWTTDEEIERPSTFLGLYMSLSKTVWRRKNGRLHFGVISEGYAKGLSYLTDYYLPEEGYLVYLGTDLDFTRKYGLFLELGKPLGDPQNSIVMNFRIKGTLPLLTFSLVRTSEGTSLVGYMNLRLTLFPPITKEGREKARKQLELKEKSKQWDKDMKELDL